MTKDEVAQLISSIVAEVGEIQGAQLARRIRDKWPEWSPDLVQSRSLGSFIEACVRDVYQAGRAGMDPIYKLLPPSGANDNTLHQSLWRIWSSPKSPFVLAVSTADGLVVPLLRAAAVPNAHLRLEPVSMEEHQGFARAFLEAEFKDGDSYLEKLIDPSKEDWWQRWYNEIRKRGLAPNWNSFRRRELESALLHKVGALPLNSNLVEIAVSHIRGHDTSKTETVRERAEATPESLQSARRTAISVIEKMSEDELRELRLPLGLVLDALKTN